MKKSWILFVLIIFATSAYASSSDRLMQKGKEAWDKGKYGEAISYFIKATEADPQDGDCFRWLGGAYYQNGQYQEAVAALKQALNLPHQKDLEADSLDWLAEAYRALGQWDSAIASRKKLIELIPDNPSNFARLSRYYCENKQYDEAITAAKRAIELKADNALAYYYLGYAYRMKKQYDESFAALKKAIEINPANALYRYEMGELFSYKHDYAEAIEAYKKAVELQPAGVNNLNYITKIAIVYSWIGKYDDTIAAINKVIPLQTYTGTGIVLAYESGYFVAKEVMETGPAQKAGIEAGDKIIEIDGKSTKGWNNEKTIQSLRGASGTQVVLTIEREGARKSIDKSVARETMIAKEAVLSFGVRSIAYRHKGSLEAALQDAQKAYSLDPANHWARYSLGASYLDRGTYDLAIKLLAQVKDSESARILEATAYAKQGKMEEAVNIYFTIPEEKMSPKYIPLMNDRLVLLQTFKPLVKEHKDKARSLEAKGQYKEALSELSEALKTADEAEAQAIQETIFSMLRKNPSLSEMLPEDAREYVLRGEILVKEGNFEKAAMEFKKAIRIAPYAARLYYNSALILAGLKKYPEAIRQMKTYLQAAPDAPDARAAKDEIYKWEFMMEKEK